MPNTNYRKLMSLIGWDEEAIKETFIDEDEEFYEMIWQQLCDIYPIELLSQDELYATLNEIVEEVKTDIESTQDNLAYDTWREEQLN